MSKHSNMYNSNFKPKTKKVPYEKRKVWILENKEKVVEIQSGEYFLPQMHKHIHHLLM